MKVHLQINTLTILRLQHYTQTGAFTCRNVCTVSLMAMCARRESASVSLATMATTAVVAVTTVTMVTVAEAGVTVVVEKHATLSRELVIATVRPAGLDLTAICVR